MIKPRNMNMKNPDIKVIPLRDCLAKTVYSKTGRKPGVSVETHCRIVGYVARELLNRLPTWLRESLFPRGSELIAAAHDVGKVSPTFQEKIHCDINNPLGIINPNLDKAIGYHFSVSQATVNSSHKYIPEILGRHHGYTQSGIQAADAEIYGGQGWQKLREDLIEALKGDLNVDWPLVSSSLQSNVLAGLTTVSDWIGSGSLFDEVSQGTIKEHISEAADRAGFLAPKIRKGITFEEIFEFSPRNVQNCFVEATQTQGVYVLEAPMGIGKTEAALYAAYKILEKGDATGIYFALPTQLTSDKIHDRMDIFLEKILDETDTNRRSLLVHSAAWLYKTELGENGSPGSSWFDDSKRGLLTPFAVGTVDQALMAVMNVKHGFVRTFGLAGKVVILDEVHSYDSYTGTILKELVMALRSLHCTVIILSATLTNKQRYAIMGASSNESYIEKAILPYPLISAYPNNGALRELETEKLTESKVKICIASNDAAAVNETLIRAERGEQILWIENTVFEAQQQYCCLAATAKGMGIECALLHSRFIKVDRRTNEDAWVNIIGKSGRNLRNKQGRILVGTQVLEQSLDIDADFLVTRLCPTDMLFQRLGRLWRHRENDLIRPTKAQREAWVLAPALNDAIQQETALGKSAKVYSPYVLCRTLEAWQNICSVCLPKDIRPLIEATYIKRDESGNMKMYEEKVEEQRDKLSRLALVGVSQGGKTLSESNASTRYSQIKTVEVMLIKAHRSVDGGTQVRLLNGTELLLPKHTDACTRREIAAHLLKNTVMVPEYLAPVNSKRQIQWLADYVYLGEYDENPFRVAIVAESGELQGIGAAVASEQYELYYDSCLGYRAKKKGSGDSDGE